MSQLRGSLYCITELYAYLNVCLLSTAILPPTHTHTQLKWFLQDRHMVILVLCLLVVDVIVLIIGTSIPNTRFTPQRVVDDEFSSYRNVICLPTLCMDGY